MASIRLDTQAPPPPWPVPRSSTLRLRRFLHPAALSFVLLTEGLPAARLGDRVTLHTIEGGDHSFGVLKRSGWTPEQVCEEVQATVLSWLDAQGL